MAVKPLSDRVLVKPNPAEEKTAGGLFIPDTAKEKPLMGKVVAVGPGTAEIKMEVKVGDMVQVGDLVAEIKEGALGARVHAGISGKVTSVDGAITIEV